METEEGLINSFWGTGSGWLPGSNYIWTGQGRINKFQEAGGKKTQIEKRWVFQEAENVLNEITEAWECRRAAVVSSGSGGEHGEGTSRTEAKEVCWCQWNAFSTTRYALITPFFSVSVLKIPLTSILRWKISGLPLCQVSICLRFDHTVLPQCWQNQSSSG